MRRVEAFVENGVSLAHEVGSAAWVFDLDLWGVCGQGTDEGDALRELARRLGYRVDLVVAERLRGDERAFERDRRPCTPAERETTLEILAQVRRETLELVASCSEQELDSVDHNRALPAFASWRTLRQMAWHIADCESRYYLPAMGLSPRPPEDDLTAELTASARHLRTHVEQVPPDVLVEQDGEVWTTVKLLRRLAWHERGELAVMHTMLARLRGVT